MLCIGLTIAILLYIDDKTVGAWKLAIQPNSLVAVFSTIAKSALLVPVAECIGQLKWIYFDSTEPKTLAHLQAYDEASRGPWGSLGLFWKTRGAASAFALAGAFITILMLAFEPFAQQVVSFSTRDAALHNMTGSVSAVMSLSGPNTEAALGGNEG
jgi:hypothetical protein